MNTTETLTTGQTIKTYGGAIRTIAAIRKNDRATSTIIFTDGHRERFFNHGRVTVVA